MPDVILPVGGEGQDYDTAYTRARSLIFGRPRIREE